MNNILTYQGFPISKREADGYLNATQMCKASDKRVNNWLETAETKAYILRQSSLTGITVNELVVAKSGSGTWIHPKLAINLGRWISIDFEIWCDDNIETLLKTGAVSIEPIPTTKLPHFYGIDRANELHSHLRNVPDRHFTIIGEVVPLLIRLQMDGYPIGKTDLLDGSIGNLYAKSRKDRGLDMWGKVAEHKDSSGNWWHINSYPNTELGDFRNWLDEEYKPTKMPSYLKSKYGTLALTA